MAYEIENIETTKPVLWIVDERFLAISGSMPAIMKASVPIANIPSASIEALRSNAEHFSKADESTLALDICPPL
jgi:hypothetical protein